ncbi:MAG: efflux RND transporter periplasmic adaptor subunit [Cytophagales bacterium]|nr:efflux RND transporter periplasmic adaptor subunit [Rhizobacter sp.]
MKTLHTVVAVVGISVAGAAAWWYQNKAPAAGGVAAAGPTASGAQPAGAGGPVLVEVGKVETMTIDDDAQGVGALRSRQGVMLRPEVSGRISRLGFGDGQRVKRGQLLVQLDDALQGAQLQQAEAQASIARTNLQRNRELVAANFVSQSVVDQSAAAMQVAEAQVALAKAQLARMRIEAPFDGVAGIRSVSVGDYVKDGADLVNVEDLSSVWLDFRLAERYVARIKTGQLIEAQLDALPGKAFKGHVDAVDSLLDANGRSLLVRARLPNTSGELRSGMFARTRVVFSTRANALVVPEEALVPLAGKQYLVKVVDGPKGKVSQRLEARIGMRLPGKVEILEGLVAGDTVVTAGQTRLLRGESLPLRVVDISRPAARAASGALRGASGAGSGAGGGVGSAARGVSGNRPAVAL